MTKDHKRSQRRAKTEVAIERQKRIANNWKLPVKNPHRFSKMKATNCGDPNCVMCGNPRKFFKERTLQEKKFIEGYEIDNKTSCI